MSDLFFSATVIAIAKKQGMTVQLISDPNLAAEKLASNPVAVILDLNFAPLALIEQIKAKNIPTIGFVSHVQVELKAKALAAGCDTVLPRSAFAQRLPELLAQLVESRVDIIGCSPDST
jgi:CheY-like chemotaxis protein